MNYSSITLKTGDGAVDNALVEYSTNSGSSWSTLLDMPKTNNAGCGGQGRWTSIAIPLPASCENIATLMVAFRWVNNNDLVGADPSFAANDVMIVQPVPLPVELVEFSGRSERVSVKLDWTTATEKNNDHFAIERSGINGEFFEIGQVLGAGNSSSTTRYSWNDLSPLNGTSFYRLRQVDNNGEQEFSKTISVDHDLGGPYSFWSAGPDVLSVQLTNAVDAKWRLFDATGREIDSGEFNEGSLLLNMQQLDAGLYVLRSQIAQRIHARPFVRP